MTATAGHVAC